MTDKHIDNLIIALQEINVLVGEWYETDRKQLGDLIETLLITAYLEGRSAAEDYLDYALDTELNLEQLDKALNLKIEGKTYRDRIDEYVEEEKLPEIVRVAETDYHRMYNTGLIDGANEIGYQTGEYITKTWVTVMDDRTRDQHAYLDGITIPLNDLFYTYDGNSAYAPGGFDTAEMNVNCRCVLTLNK